MERKNKGLRGGGGSTSIASKVRPLIYSKLDCNTVLYLENTEVKMEDEQETKDPEKENLNSKHQSDRRGTKRSVKDRLGNYRVPIDR